MFHPGSIVIPAALAVVLVAGSSEQATPQKPAAPATKADIAQLWIEPEGERDLFYGPGGQALAPDPSVEYRVTEVKIGGFSEGYVVVDPSGREWFTKFPPEAGSEVALSRIHWGLGYHQPPMYMLQRWNARGAKAPNPQLPSRFSEKDPDFHGLKFGDDWAFDNNPFVGTRPLGGLLVLQALLENQDIKAANNTIYDLNTTVEGARRWFVIRDLGYSLGQAKFNGPRNDIEAYEKAPFIRDVVDGRVRFHFGGRYKKLMDNITVDDVIWICERLERITPKQWRDAFRAGGYEDRLADRFIVRIKSRAAEGLALKDR